MKRPVMTSYYSRTSKIILIFFTVAIFVRIKFPCVEWLFSGLSKCMVPWSIVIFFNNVIIVSCRVPYRSTKHNTAEEEYGTGHLTSVLLLGWFHKTKTEHTIQQEKQSIRPPTATNQAIHTSYLPSTQSNKYVFLFIYHGRTIYIYPRNVTKITLLCIILPSYHRNDVEYYILLMYLVFFSLLLKMYLCSVRPIPR